MELWVRSQNKEILMKVEELGILANNYGDKWFICNFKETDESKTYLGTYKTKERALELLDEIQDLLRFAKLRKYTGDGLISVENNIALYIMPKE